MTPRIPATLFLSSLLLAAAAQAQTSVFRDDFTASLKPGWTILNEDASHHSISSQGTYHITTQRGGLGSGKTANNLLLRPIAGNFIIETRLQENPTTAQQWGAMLVYVDGTAGVINGLVFAQGTSSTFRGVVGLSSTGDPNTANRGGAFYDDTVTPTPDIVYLRMLRNGQQFAMSYSPDGVTYTELKSVENDAIPDTVYVGIGAANGDYPTCGSACDTASIPADFDYFEIKDYDGTTKLDPNAAPPTTGVANGGGGSSGGTSAPTVTDVAIDGPDRVAPGGTATYSLTGTFSDSSTDTLTTGVTWIVAPPDRASISNGQLTITGATDPSRVTVVATYAPSGGVSRTASKLVDITSKTSSTPAGLCGGLGAFSLVPLAGLGLIALRTRRANQNPKR